MTARPHTILHNSVSLDGSISGFELDKAAQYRLASSFEADSHLTGSVTALTGIEMYGEGLRAEPGTDFKPSTGSGLPPWTMVDSGGRLQGKLHALRNSQLGGDPIVLVSESTLHQQVDYLTECAYRHHATGGDRVNLDAALELLAGEYGFRTVLVDSGRSLNGALLNNGLVDHVSLLIVPLIVGAGGLPLFRNVSAGIKLRPMSEERIMEGALWLQYDVAN